jgi:hypothetical protein
LGLPDVIEIKKCYKCIYRSPFCTVGFGKYILLDNNILGIGCKSGALNIREE